MYGAHNSAIAGGHGHAVDATIATVALRSCGVRPADVCFHDCDNATRPDLTAALGRYPPRVVRRRLDSVACSQPPAASLSKHYRAPPPMPGHSDVRVPDSYVALNNPPCTSQWNKIEHRLFLFITMNWRGKPLVSLETIINLIAGTTTSTGLEVYARLDEGVYPDKIKVTDAEFTDVNIHGHEFHPEWNYIIRPHGQ